MPFSQTLLLTELAEYLRLPPPTVEGLVERGVLPGERAEGRWRFRRWEVDHWLDLGMPGWAPSVHPAMSGVHERVPISLRSTLGRGNVLLDVSARDLDECFERAIAAFELPAATDRRAVVNAIRERERLCSTALDNGFALPHTRRAGPRLVEANVVGFVRLSTPVAADGTSSTPVDLLFFVFAREPGSHLRLLSRAARLAHEASLARALRKARQPGGVFRAIAQAERRLFPPTRVLSIGGSGGQPRPTQDGAPRLPGGDIASLAAPMLWDRLRATYARIWRDWEAGPRPSDPMAAEVARLVGGELQQASGTSGASVSAARPEGSTSRRLRDYVTRVLPVITGERHSLAAAAIVFEQVRRSLEDSGFNRSIAWRLCLALHRAGVIAGEPNRPYLGRRAQLVADRLLAETGLRARVVEDLEAGLMIAADLRLALAGQRLDAEALTEACSQLAQASTALLTTK